MSTSAAAIAPSAVELEMARLRAENEKLRKRVPHAPEITFKVAEKGGLSVYGLGRWPVTLYKEQWARLLDKADAIRAFIAANDRRLKSKDEAKDDA